MFRRILRCNSGAFATQFAILTVPLLLSAGIAVDFSRMVNAKTELQGAADAAALSSAKLKDLTEQQREAAAKKFFVSNSTTADGMKNLNFSATMISPTRLRVTAKGSIPPMFVQIGGYPRLDVAIASEVEIAVPNATPCVTVLSNTPQALLFNSGASIAAPDCELHVHSQSNPAFIHNAGVSLDLAKICVKGTQYINNGNAMPTLETGCAAISDPYSGKFNEPALPVNCESSGVRSAGNHTFDPGMHCGTIVHGASNITFKPGLHIIRDRMILDAGATVTAQDVTFYFPNTDSEIRANGGLTFKASAPKTGPYKGILMFEKTSNASNNSQKRQYIFNGSVNEQLEGIIYLPNRDVTYNSTSNVSASKINLVANTMIVNSANWNFKAYEGGSGGAGSSAPRLVN